MMSNRIPHRAWLALCQFGELARRNPSTSAAVRKQHKMEALMTPLKNIAVFAILGVSPVIPDKALPNAPQYTMFFGLVNEMAAPAIKAPCCG